MRPTSADVESFARFGEGARMNEPDANSRVESRWATVQEVREVTTSLLAEVAGLLPAGTVIRCVARAREQLLGAGVRAGLAVAVESMARLRLAERLPTHGHRDEHSSRRVARPAPGGPASPAVEDRPVGRLSEPRRT
jgi:hypothetical protein